MEVRAHTLRKSDSDVSTCIDRYTSQFKNSYFAEM